MRICMPVFVHSLSYLYYVLGSPRCSPPSLPALGIVLATPIPSNAMNPSLQPVDVCLEYGRREVKMKDRFDDTFLPDPVLRSS
ncbi:hypothetical protein CABS01_01219 [Colletotrichum abscissum]|uniref:uncharacterized protein n=1 Tax=Colletotrichum abscissum TaxID=1671311 RepID=UPI0027D60E96|nr:uncharacterized protein CABS01_01219 [Colletotrichum abscissum]KAK1505751.1 hypothetical protein CABS01_01219 [Colletotrichum abscissum]